MREIFPKAIELMLVHEGGYVNHPKDPGGATNRGVTQRVYNAYRVSHGLELQNVKSIAEQEIHDIYKKQYWDRTNCDMLPAGLDYCVFDAGVNSGPSRAAKWLQRVLGLPIDGIIGMHTLAAAQACDPEKTINRFCDARLAFVKSLRTWKVFGRGWSRRISEVRRMAVYMAGAAEPKIAAPIEPIGKADEADIAATAVVKDKSFSGEGMVVAGGMGETVNSLANTLFPFKDVSQVLTWLFIALIAAGAVFTILKLIKKYRSGEVHF